MQPKYKPPLLHALLPCLLFFSGCVPTSTIPPESGAAREQHDRAPEPEPLVTQPLIRNDQPSQTVELYQYPSPLSLQEQNQQRLQSVDSLIQSGDGTSAKQTADTINSAELSPEQSAQLRLLYAQIQLSFGEAEQAIESLAQIQPQQLDLENHIKYLQSQAFAYSLTGNQLESTKSRIKLHSLITSPIELEKNQAAILEALSLLPDSDLQATQTDALAGWMSLANILKYINRPDFSVQINQWRITFPTHPANLSFLDNPQYTQKSTQGHPKTMALLLPESGTFAQAGKAIRAGFMAAYNHTSSHSKPVIRFYDSEQLPPVTLYDQAVSEGAQLIIGPLAKEQIQSLADTTASFNIPVLALNHIPGLQKNQLYQFSLSPLDDTEQITRKAREDGYQKALLLVPDNSTGKRTASYLKEDWQNLDGTLLETQAYNPKETDFSSSIQKLLNLDESEQRYNKILTLIPGIKYTPRRRQDADVILLSANSAEARSVNPQLQFYQAGDLPVYAMPTIFSGQVNTALDADLNKITFCDIPWLFNKTYQGELGMDALQKTWMQFPSSYFRLIAMGIDAYNLMTRLDNLEAGSYSGATGDLSLTKDQRIKRKLTCAKFIDGQPENTNPAPNIGQPDNHAIQ